MKIWSLALLGAFIVPATPAAAAFITTQEAGLDLVFSQASFGADTVDIRFTASETITDGFLLNIDTEAKLNQLLTHPTLADAPTVNMIFVDAVDYCDTFNENIVGCATVGGNFIVVESAYAAGGNGIELNAHELGHNLGLSHIAGSNLMNGSINGNTDLWNAATRPSPSDPDQISSILASPLIQDDAGQKFISITPYLVQSTTVPEPSSWTALFSLAAFGLVWQARRRRRPRPHESMACQS